MEPSGAGGGLAPQNWAASPGRLMPEARARLPEPEVRAGGTSRRGVAGGGSAASRGRVEEPEGVPVAGGGGESDSWEMLRGVVGRQGLAARRRASSEGSCRPDGRSEAARPIGGREGGGASGWAGGSAGVEAKGTTAL
ncbi:hypothetical protein [Thermomonospora umbrina]|uniref:hypothetical protein n=1 Tax=Thermomonospora umbrina TaxID=111806 RepID=UPI001FE2D5F9|nr:hypothetical protein [Thermomonospora umbrina]